MSADRILTRPRLQYDEVIRFIDNIEGTRTWLYDVSILSGMVKMAYYVGLKKEELIQVKVSAIIFEDDMPTKLRVGDTEINFFMYKVAQVFIQEHLALLYEKYTASPRSLLFPANRNGEPFNESTLQKYLRSSARQGNFSRNLNLNSIRQVGICRYYEQRIEESGRNINYNRILEDTAAFARCTVKHTKTILEDNIPSFFNKHH